MLLDNEIGGFMKLLKITGIVVFMTIVQAIVRVVFNIQFDGGYLATSFTAFMAGLLCAYVYMQGREE
jgi:hypothetical protein